MINAPIPLFKYCTTNPPLLSEGEMVYKVIAQLNTSSARNYFRTYSHMLQPNVILRTMMGCNPLIESLAKHREDGNIYRISTTLLGYVGSSRVEGGQEGVIEKSILYGYNIMWENNNKVTFQNFEDESRLLPLKSIIILDAEELRRELMSG